MSTRQRTVPGMRLAPPNDIPRLTVMGGSTTTNADGTVEATNPTDVLALLSAGWVQVQAALTEVSFPGRLRFELSAQSHMIAALCGAL